MKKLLMILASITILSGIPGVITAQDYKPGMVAFLIERQNHIPVHAAPGDHGVAFRFESGSKVTILSIDPESSWIEVKGKPIAGNRESGWIIQSYIQKIIQANDSTALELGWCLPKNSPIPRHKNRIRIATWNLGNLHAQDNESVYTGNRPSIKRTEIDYERIKCYIRSFDPDILAVQEVDGKEALLRIVDRDVYDVHVSERPQGSLNGKQNTGFAFKRGLDVIPQPSFIKLDIENNGYLRYGARIDLKINDYTIRLMSVHLKSGCFSNSSTSPACDQFYKQIPILESWIDDAAQKPESFIVLGDFNRRFNFSNDKVWQEIDDGDPPNSDLTTVTFGMPITCRDNRYTEFIDHIVLDKRAVKWVDLTSCRQQSFRQQDKLHWDKISDHCPVIVELWIE